MPSVSVVPDDGATPEYKEQPLFKSPLMAYMMRPMFRKMMGKAMTVTDGKYGRADHKNDCTQKEVGDFMVPSSTGAPFLDLPGTFDPNMKPRTIEKMGGLKLDRKQMVLEPAPHNLGITWEKYCDHRGYTRPGAPENSPKVGDLVPDGKILNLEAGGPESTLLTEARKLAEAAGSTKVILAFVGVTCPFYRGYCAYDLYCANKSKVPTLHIYQRESEPCDVFDAGGMHMATPLAMRRPVRWHKTETDRRLVAKETQHFLEGFMGKGKVPMWLDTMDDALEAAYESRPWRQYVIEIKSGKVIAKLGLAPFNNPGKCKVITAATQTK